MNPNGLTDKQIAARPEPFVGMLAYIAGEEEVPGDGWFTVYRFEVIHFNNPAAGTTQFIQRECLLPGEPGCPWPPPGGFRRVWKQGDRALILQDGEWEHFYAEQDDGGLCFWHTVTFCRLPLDTPAIYIPGEGER